MSLFDQLTHAAQSDVGVRRGHNQDAYAVLLAADAEAFRRHGHVFIVADGMGGHAVGEKASAKAAGDIPLTYQKHAHDGTLPALARAFTEANADIHEIGSCNPEFAGSGTTATALVLTPDGAWVGHVGDSRAYRVRRGVIEQLSFDHSHVWEIARRRGVRPDQVTGVPTNRINRSLGPDGTVEVDVEGPHPVEPGDLFVLCSDGLSGQLDDDEIGAVATALPPAEACRVMIDLANLRGGPDNITVLVVGVDPAAAIERPAGPKALDVWAARARAALESVPWFFYAIFGGLLLSIGAVYMLTERIAGGSAVFVLALAAVSAGLGGVVLRLRQPDADPPAPAAPRPRKLHLYSKTKCEPTAKSLARLAAEADQLAAALREKNTPTDWAAHDARRAAADAVADPAAGFPDRVRAFALLMRAFHGKRQKEEVFNPNWQRKAT